jgi:hypothetical protein
MHTHSTAPTSETMGVDPNADQWNGGHEQGPEGDGQPTGPSAWRPEENLPPVPTQLPRDRIVVLGRRAAGKTTFLARFYEALWQGCLVPGSKRNAKDGKPPAPVEMKARCKHGSRHKALMGVIDSLKKGTWPVSTTGLDYIEMVITHGGRQHVLSTLDFSGEVFKQAFFDDSDQPSPVELRNAVDRAAAVVLLLDPAVVAKGGEDAQEDAFGLTQAVVRIRQAVGGAHVPIAIAFTKCDENKSLLREAGGAQAFAQKHLRQLITEVKSAAVFPSVAVRASVNTRGTRVPNLADPPSNVVEPILYCIRAIEIGGDMRVAEESRRELEEEVRRAELAEAQVAQGPPTNWWKVGMIVVGSIVLLAAVAIGTYLVIKDA